MLGTRTSTISVSDRSPQGRSSPGARTSTVGIGDRTPQSRSSPGVATRTTSGGVAWETPSLSRSSSSISQPTPSANRPSVPRLSGRPRAGTATTSSSVASSPPARASRRSYAPSSVLTDMGFDEESAKAAMVAAGGDVDRAVRIILGDSEVRNVNQNAEWEFEADNGWVAFDAEQDDILRDASARGMTSCELRTGGRRYFVDFDKLTQQNIHSQKCRRIRRRKRNDRSSGSSSWT